MSIPLSPPKFMDKPCFLAVSRTNRVIRWATIVGRCTKLRPDVRQGGQGFDLFGPVRAHTGITQFAPTNIELGPFKELQNIELRWPWFLFIVHVLFLYPFTRSFIMGNWSGVAAKVAFIHLYGVCSDLRSFQFLSYLQLDARASERPFDGTAFSVRSIATLFSNFLCVPTVALRTV